MKTVVFSQNNKNFEKKKSPHEKRVHMEKGFIYDLNRISGEWPELRSGER
jgi:hypothetical protein